MDIRHHHKTDGTDHQTHGIGQFRILELREQGGPDDRAYRLYGKEDAHPVTGLLKSLAGRIGGVPYHLGNGACRIVPHIEHGRPTEELYQTHLPERGGRILEQRDPVGTILLLFRNRIILGILLRIPLTYFRGGIEHTKDEDSRADIERPDDRIRHDTLFCHIADANECEDKGKHITHHRTSIAKERLNRIGLGLLLLVDHIPHQHLKRLHGHIDARIKEHQGNESEDHGGTDSQT